MWPLSAYLASGEVPRPNGSAMSTIVPYQVFDTADAKLMVAAANDGLFGRLCGALGRAELALDARFARNSRRVANRAALVAILSEMFLTRSAADWEAALTACGVPAAPLQDVAAVAAAEQTEALGMIGIAPGDTTPQVALPISFNGSRPPLARRSPRRGADNAAILGTKSP
jgi:crotonobetainyl-CoA:carnitine CoA-transferase CaiB-like acyl-CoA transferase